ncbi:TenA family protein [Thalassobius sp. S69A]|uniref:TenA family protein n=1 Tax=unclassified Thalassovita TaxID=2619711 RepID=UPI000C117E96|nr:TENA/THI-4 family protein [Paracoccaceae bacterium]MBT26309.1 TENA/THI-4 family protein [Paracoccaceae bacterium]
MRPTDLLRQQSQADWTAATTHEFTDALGAGTLPPEKMAGYLQQDYLFVDGFVRLLASAIAHAPTLADGVPAAQFLGLVTSDENTYFLRSLDALGYPAQAEPAPQTLAFQELMTMARHSGRYELMLAVLVVAEWVYLDWAAPMEQRAADLPFWLGEWITLHSGPGFEGVVAYLRGQLDQIWPHLAPSAQDDVQRLFAQTVAAERAFFDAAWAGFAVAT